MEVIIAMIMAVFIALFIFILVFRTTFIVIYIGGIIYRHHYYDSNIPFFFFLYHMQDVLQLLSVNLPILSTTILIPNL